MSSLFKASVSLLLAGQASGFVVGPVPAARSARAPAMLDQLQMQDSGGIERKTGDNVEQCVS